MDNELRILCNAAFRPDEPILHMFIVCSMAYDTDLTDAQWLKICRYIPVAKKGGRPRTTDPRRVVDAILYFLKTGVQWQQLPRDFPPYSTVYWYFRGWNKVNVWSKILKALNVEARKREGRAKSPSVLIIDSQSVKTGRRVHKSTKGIDGGKKVLGRKRHMVVDSTGLLVDLSIMPANRHDIDGGKRVINRIQRRHKLKTVQVVCADKGYQGKRFADCVKQKLGAIVHIGKNLTNAVDGFVPDAQRWKVERSFAWINNNYRLSFDREQRPPVSAALVRIAFIRLLLNRLCPS